MRLLLLLAALTMAPGRADAALKDGKLPPCSKSSMNCAYAEVKASGLASDVLARVHAALKELPRTDVREAKGNYLRARSKSWLFRFKDDVEFFYDEAAGVLQIRSQSRVGAYDFGVNQRRVKKLVELLSKPSAP